MYRAAAPHFPRSKASDLFSTDRHQRKGIFMAAVVCSINIRVPESVRPYAGALVAVVVLVVLGRQGIVSI